MPSLLTGLRYVVKLSSPVTTCSLGICKDTLGTKEKKGLYRQKKVQLTHAQELNQIINKTMYNRA
jgi:hypothetical protein